MDLQALPSLLRDAFQARRQLHDAGHQSALRLFSGFTEGCPDLVIDLYGETAVFHNYADVRSHGEALVQAAMEELRAELQWVQAGLVKARNSASADERRGRMAFGQQLTTRIREGDLWYAVDLTLHQDCSFYLDTRNLRKWASEHLRDKTVLNTFAYTGSLGIAALGGGARRVVQLDRTKRFLDLARTSCALNGFLIQPADFVHADFFREAGRLRRRNRAFDCVFLDPPFFASGSTGVVDQEAQSSRLINKVRPLIVHGGTLVAINNALYVSGHDYMQALESLCADGYLRIRELIPIPEDFTGYPATRAGTPITDPGPFNSSTKIAVLEVKRRV